MHTTLHPLKKHNMSPLPPTPPHTPPHTSTPSQALVTNSSDKKSSASITIFLASNGADIYLKNFKEQTPLDLCPDPHLLKLLTRCNLEHHSTCTTQPHNDNPQNGIPVKIRVKVRNHSDSVERDLFKGLILTDLKGLTHGFKGLILIFKGVNPWF